MKINLIAIFLLFGSHLSAQQQLLNQLLPASGDYKSETLNINWSLGEIFDGNFKNSSVQSSDGFNEANSIYIVTSITELPDEDIILFPNPFTSTLTLQTPLEGEPLLSFHDQQGKSLSFTISHKDNLWIINPGEIASGAYIIKVIYNKEVQQFKIIRK